MPSTDGQLGTGRRPSPHPRTEDSSADVSPIGQGESPGTVLEAANATRSLQAPASVLSSAAAWLCLSALSVWLGSGAFDETAAKPDLYSTMNADPAASLSSHPQDLLAFFAGLAVFPLAVALVFGKRWAPSALSGMSVAIVVILALGGHLAAAIAFLLFVVAGVLLLSDSAQRFLNTRR